MKVEEIAEGWSLHSDPASGSNQKNVKDRKA